MCHQTVIVAILCLIGFASSAPIPIPVVFKDCGHKEITKITSDLSNGTAFILHKGKDFTFDAAFKADYSSANVTVQVKVMVAGQIIPVKELYTDGCTEGGLSCPLKAGADYDLKYLSRIPQNHPSISANLIISLIDEMERILGCFEVAVDIQD